MAELSPLAGLLDRAGKVFSLAGDLARAIFDEQKSASILHDPSLKERIIPPFEELWNALLATRDEMDNPPDGFAPVADHLKKTARVAIKLKPYLERKLDVSTCLDFAPNLNSVFQEGWQAVKQVSKALRVDEPFAFLDEPQTVTGNVIDTTPASPEPPRNLIEAAERDIPQFMADVQPRSDGTVELIASHLVHRLQNAGHVFAAAQWAVHEAIKVGRLEAVRIDRPQPAILPPVGGWQQDCDKQIVARHTRKPGESGLVVISVPIPTQYDAFKVMATKRLCDWWHTLSLPSNPSSMGTGQVGAAAIAASPDVGTNVDLSASTPSRKTLEDLPDPQRNAYQAYLWAEGMILESKGPDYKVTDVQAYEYIKVQGLPDDFLTYALPSRDTFVRYCQAARTALGLNKNDRKEKLSPNGKTIVRADQIER